MRASDIGTPDLTFPWVALLRSCREAFSYVRFICLVFILRFASFAIEIRASSLASRSLRTPGCIAWIGRI